MTRCKSKLIFNKEYFMSGDYLEMYDFEPEGAPNYALLREARDVIASIPERQFDLNQIVTEIGASKVVGTIVTDGNLDSGCGTIACAAGWLALTPRFQALGLTVQLGCGFRSQQFVLAYQGISTDSQSGYNLAMGPLFNLTLDQAENLFADSGKWRGGEECLSEGTSDKELFLARIDALIGAETPAE